MHKTPRTVKERIVFQKKAVKHHRYVCKRGRNYSRRWHCSALKWAKRELAESLAQLPPPMSHWIARQIRVATIIARESVGDPWPNCPDPYDGSGASWHDTVRCENRGNWMDSPGFYRCGLQFNPGWERRFGRLCP